MPMRKVTSRDDVEYDPDVMLRARRTIAGHVKSGYPVLVGCAFDPKTSMLKDGHLQATRDGGHTVLIAFAIHRTTSLFSISIPDRDLDHITPFNHGDFEGLYHQATIPGLVQVIHCIVINQQFLTNQQLVLQDEVHNDSPFAWVK
jgi:hypothetical protein